MNVVVQNHSLITNVYRRTSYSVYQFLDKKEFHDSHSTFGVDWKFSTTLSIYTWNVNDETCFKKKNNFYISALQTFFSFHISSKQWSYLGSDDGCICLILQITWSWQPIQLYSSWYCWCYQIWVFLRRLCMRPVKQLAIRVLLHVIKLLMLLSGIVKSNLAILHKGLAWLLVPHYWLFPKTKKKRIFRHYQSYSRIHFNRISLCCTDQ